MWLAMIFVLNSTHSIFIRSHSLVHLDAASNHTHTKHQPLSKQDKLYTGKTITKEYAKEFDYLSKKERMGLDFNVSRISIGGSTLAILLEG